MVYYQDPEFRLGFPLLQVSGIWLVLLVGLGITSLIRGHINGCNATLPVGLLLTEVLMIVIVPNS